MNTLKRYLLITGGLLALALGTIGIIMPLLPTTPFYLLAAYCFVRSSKRLHQWLIHHRVFGAYIYHYLEYGAVKKSAKISALLLLWVSLSISIYLVGRPVVTVILILIGSAVSIHILKLKTYEGHDGPGRSGSG